MASSRGASLTRPRMAALALALAPTARLQPPRSSRLPCKLAATLHSYLPRAPSTRMSSPPASGTLAAALARRAPLPVRHPPRPLACWQLHSFGPATTYRITIATLLSFLSGALAQTHKFCYSAVASSSVVLILPGFIVLCGSLELSSRNIVAGAVRLCYALVYSLFLGFGLAIGAETYEKLTGLSIFGPEDYLCARSHGNAPWFRKTPSHFWAFLTVPTYSLFLSLRNQAPWYRKELAILVAISCLGWVTNHFVSIKFPNQSDISAAVGAFAVGVTANIYGRLFRGNAFAVMITGVLFQLPSGLGNGGLLHFASQQASGSSASYLSGFQVALQLISVSVGLTVGLGISLVLVFPIQSRKRKSGVFSL
ncbi:hypothetical protein BC826DRAFT_1112266 [Russula brevipes]|nr:hypothetical protein BC826DRAFT_1112266 [Russula brevipes]